MDETKSAEEQAQLSAERRVYELGYHIVPTITEEALAQAAASIKERIEKLGGTTIAGEDPTHVTLAYTMVRTRGGKREKFASAHFGWVKFEMDAEQVHALKEELDADDSILRFLLFTTVREDTRAPKRVLAPQPKPSEPIRPKLTDDASKQKDEKKEESVLDKELDRTIEELVVE